MSMNILDLQKIAEYHAKKVIRTKNEFFKIADYYERIDNCYIFYALYKGKRRIKAIKIAINSKGRFICSCKK